MYHNLWLFNSYKWLLSASGISLLGGYHDYKTFRLQNTLRLAITLPNLSASRRSTFFLSFKNKTKRKKKLLPLKNYTKKFFSFCNINFFTKIKTFQISFHTTSEITNYQPTTSQRWIFYELIKSVSYFRAKFHTFHAASFMIFVSFFRLHRLGYIIISN